MLSKIRKRLQQEEGFTLIELLVVVLIIGILAAVAIPTFLSQKNKANDSNVVSNLKNAQTVVEAYAASNNGTYPAQATTGASLSTVLSGDTDASALSSIYYSSTGGTADTYNLWGVSPNGEGYELSVVGGVVTYEDGTTTQTTAGATAPTLAGTSTTAFPAAPGN